MKLASFAQDVWVCYRPLKFFGINIGTRMTVIRLGEFLLVISPIDVDEETVAEIKTIGEVKWIVAPNAFHHLFIKDFQNSFPYAELWIPQSLHNKRSDLSYTKILGEAPHPEQWLAEVQVFPFDSSPKLGEFFFFHNSSKVLVVTDAFFNFSGKLTLKEKIMLWLFGSKNEAKPDYLVKLFIKNHKHGAREALQKAIDLGTEKIVIAHGLLIEENATEVLEEVASHI